MRQFGRNRALNKQSASKPDTYCYGCMVDTAQLAECSTHSACFIGKDKWDKLKTY